MKEQQHSSKRRGWVLGVLLSLLAVSGLAFSAWQTGQFKQSAAVTPTSPYQTTTVRRGNLSLSATGNGNLIATQTVNLGFSTTGDIATLNVKVGNQVKAGQVLAELNGAEQRKVNVQTQQLAVEVAQQALDDLQASAAGNVASALATQASSQAAVATAQAGIHYKGDPRCAPSLTEEYYFKYLYAQENVDHWQNLNNPNSGYGSQYVLQNLNPAKRARDLAYYNYVYCQGYTDQEIQASQANLQIAQVNVKQAENTYQMMQSNKGIDPNTLQLDQAQLKNAQAQLAKAQADLEGMTLVAPFDGVVTAVNGSVGQPAGASVSTDQASAGSTPTGQSSGNSSSTSSSSASSSTTGSTSGSSTSTGKGVVLTVADVNHPRVQMNIDETDLQNFGTGCSAQVTFTALPNQPFTGVVDWVGPSLITTNGASSAQGQVSLNPPPAGVSMPLLGSTASVVVTCQSAQNVLLVPQQALYQPAGQPAYVYILNQQGQPEKRVVQLGLQTNAFAEIRSGLNEGDRVVTTPESQLNRTRNP
jgi:HlyD family secretion protein